MAGIHTHSALCSVRLVQQGRGQSLPLHNLRILETQCSAPLHSYYYYFQILKLPIFPNNSARGPF